MSWVIGLFALGIGTGLGALLARTVFAKNDNQKANALQEQLDSLQTQQQEYRQKVDQHFNQSAELFQEMTENYRKIYHHLSEGAQSLCENPPKQLEQALEGSHLVETETVQEQLTHQQEEEITAQAAANESEMEELKAEAPPPETTQTSVTEMEASPADSDEPVPPRPEEIKAADIEADTETEMDNTEAPPTAAANTQTQPTLH